MVKRDIVICSPVRTAIGTYNGTLKDTPAVELGATTIKACLERAGVAGKDVGTVVMGNVIQAGNKMNPARQAAIGGGIPVEVPAMTVNRVCGSGAQAIATAAAEIQLGLMDTAVAGGMENMDAAPYLMYGARWGYRMGTAQIYDAMLQDGLNDAFSGEHSGWHTEDLVTQNTDHARRSGRMGPALAAAVLGGSGCRQVRRRDRSGDGQVAQGTATLREGRAQSPGYDGREFGQAETGLPKGRHDHGRQCARSQYGAAAAMLLAERTWADKNGVKPLGRLVSWGVGAVEPGMFGLGPVPAVKQALERAGWNIGDVERFEINEAFAAIALAVMRDLGLPEDIVNVEGNSIAHGHPIGATGAIQTTRLLHSMQRDGIKRGVVTMCIGGGQGIALCLEAPK